jgi:hypothetical protein
MTQVGNALAHGLLMGYANTLLVRPRIVSTPATALTTNNVDTDVYTCPAGKRALVIGANGVNTGTQSATAVSKIKVSGTAYRLEAGLVFNASTAGNLASPHIALDSGESFTVNVQGTAGFSFNIYPSIIEVDASTPIFMAKLFSMTVGDNTLYTCPSGKAAFPISLNGAWARGGFRYINDSGSTRSISVNFVPSGSSAAAGNRIRSASSIVNGSQDAGPPLVPTFAAGDVLSVNTDGTGASQIAVQVLVEIPV